jgi:NTE family protein
MKRYIILPFVFFILAFYSGISVAQQPDGRPRIGLALSGGGSHGLAHIGVLKVMEEAGLRPDYITGVSMGSVIGALYSIGYNTDTLMYILRTADWNLILSDNLPEDKVIFTEKKYFNNSIISLPVSFKKVKLPSGLIIGQQVEKNLSYFFWPAADINDFTKLPIPFLCIGTDLISCKKVILREGYLPDAIRASISVPSIFAPIKIDSAILVDGGFVRNIAVSELKEMGADIIIGSYTGFHRYSEDELQSVSGVLKQLSFFNSINDYIDQKKLIDFLIEPDVKDFPITVFTNSDSIIARGYYAALPLKGKFKKLADSLNRIEPHKQVEFLLNKNKNNYIFNSIEISGNNIITNDQILGILDIKPGDRINRDILSERIDLLYGRAWFDKIKYKIVPDNDSLNLHIECIEKPQAMLYGSIHYDNYLNQGVLLNLKLENLLFSKSISDIDSYIGEFYRFRFNHTQFIGRNQRLGFSAFFNAANNPIPVMSIADETGKITYRLLGAGFNFNRRTGLNHLISISGSYENLNLIPDFISSSNLKRISYNYLSASFINQVNTIDTKHFPNKGILFNFEFNTTNLISGGHQTRHIKNTYKPDLPGEFLFKRSYTFLSNFKHYSSPSNKVSISFGADLLLSYTSDSITSPHNYYFAGGNESTFNRSIPLTGFHPGEIIIDEFAGLRFDFDIEIIKSLHLNLSTNLALAREPGTVGDVSMLGGYGVGLGYNSVAGPLKIGIMHGFSDKERYFNPVKAYISLGFNF